MTGSFGEMGNLLKQAQQMQRELDRVRGELREKRLEGTSGGGAVQVEVDGEGQVQSVRIQPEVLSSGDVSVVEDLVLAAVRDGLTRAGELRNKEMSRLTGGLNLPGMF